MANEHINKHRLHDEGITHFLVPLLPVCLSFYISPWYITLLLVTGVLFLVGKEYLFAVFAGLSFFNIMNVEDVPFWASLITSYFALGIIALRIGVFKRKVPVSFFIPVFLLLLIILSFVFKTIGEEFLMTGVKSSLQLMFILLTIQTVSLVPDRYLDASRQVFERYFLPFIVLYLVIAAIFFDPEHRFGAATGPQCLALQLALVLCYFNTQDLTRRGVQLFLLVPIFLTGSRTYFFLACLVLAYDYFRVSPRRIKLIILTNVVIVAVLALLILPYTDSRFDYTSETFAGSFWGRFRNYHQSMLLIKEHPVTGNGMGAILRVLEGWEYKEGYDHYRQKGDTTIIHNEYLRILVELGLLGFTVILFGVAKLWRRLKSRESKYMVFLFLTASLVENTLTLYTTGTLLFVLLLAFSNVSKPHHSDAEDIVSSGGNQVGPLAPDNKVVSSTC